jgi:hypothetical protein
MQLGQFGAMFTERHSTEHNGTFAMGEGYAYPSEYEQHPGEISSRDERAVIVSADRKID